MSRRLWLSLRRLLEVHSSGDCGSPRVSGSTSARRSSSKFASVSLRGLRPPPTRRTRSKSGVSPARNSASPRPIVLRAIPVARITAIIPPCPADVASAAAKRRRPRSSSTGERASKRWRMADSSITPKRYSLATPEGIPPPTKSEPTRFTCSRTGPKYMVKRCGPSSQGWSTFLRNHAPDIAAMDFFVVPTIGFKVLYVIIRLDRRDLVWINVTTNPTAEWVARQITEAFPWDEAPRYVIRDRDQIYGAVVTRRLRAMGIRDKPITPASPWQNGFAERLIGSIRRECLDHLIVFGEEHLRRILKSYADYYNCVRTHRSLHKDAPVSRPVQRSGIISSHAILGGLHHQYVRI